MRRARGGDRRAFGELYEAFAPALYRRILMPKLGNPQAAEDALAETFRVLLERIDRYEDQGKGIWHWLARVAGNKATDMHRVKGRTTRALASFEGLLAPLRHEPTNPAEAAETSDWSRRIRETVPAVLGRIKPRYRRAIELRFMQDRPRRECAEAMGVKLGTFDVVILRALRAFRREWEATVGAAPEEA